MTSNGKSKNQTEPIQNGVSKTHRTKTPRKSFIDHLRTGSQTGLWCSLLIPILLYSSLTGDSDQAPPPFKTATLIVSCYLSAASVFACFHLVYDPSAKDDKTNIFR